MFCLWLGRSTKNPMNAREKPRDEHSWYLRPLSIPFPGEVMIYRMPPLPQLQAPGASVVERGPRDLCLVGVEDTGAPQQGRASANRQRAPLSQLKES